VVYDFLAREIWKKAAYIWQPKISEQGFSLFSFQLCMFLF
jgi:hypothetical protein